MSAVALEGAPPSASADTVSTRNTLATQYRFYVLKIARSIAASLPVHVEIDDLIGWGHMGLLEAAARYDPSRGTSFRTFAHPRIKGAIYDGIRRELGPSSQAERAAAEHRYAGAIYEMVGDAGYTGVVEGWLPSADDMLERNQRGAAACQDREVWLRELRERLERAMTALSPMERAIVHQHYVLGNPVKSVALRTRYSKSWLSRVHARALAKLRARLLADAAGKEIFL